MARVGAPFFACTYANPPENRPVQPSSIATATVTGIGHANLPTPFTF